MAGYFGYILVPGVFSGNYFYNMLIKTWPFALL